MGPFRNQRSQVTRIGNKAFAKNWSLVSQSGSGLLVIRKVPVGAVVHTLYLLSMFQKLYIIYINIIYIYLYIYIIYICIYMYMYIYISCFFRSVVLQFISQLHQLSCRHSCQKHHLQLENIYRKVHVKYVSQ